MFEILGLLLLIAFAIFWFPYTMQTTKFGAPFVPTKTETVEKIMKLAKIKKGEVFYDLGSGDGRLVIAAALRETKAYGVEIDLLRVLYSRAWIYLLRLSKKAKIIRKNFFDTDLSEADIVCLFLLQETNERIQKKLEKELRKGTRVISIAFDFPGWKPKEVVSRKTTYGPIYLYIKG